MVADKRKADLSDSDDDFDPSSEASPASAEKPSKKKAKPKREPQDRDDGTSPKKKKNDDALRYGIDLTDLYYDFDVPGDQYPFGDGEDWVPASWKPPKTGDSKYLPTKMLGQIQIRLNQYEAIKECEAAGVEIGDLCVPFEDYDGEYDTNAKRLIEMRRRLEAAK